jgi:uncharacterized OsmC-like protein
MLGTFGGALEARHVDASGGKLTADVRGEVDADGGVLVIRRIHVSLVLRGPASVGPVVERVHAVYADRCPIFRSLKGAILITSSVQIVDP